MNRSLDRASMKSDARAMISTGPRVADDAVSRFKII
jgi:hypothetical protein